MVKRGEEKVRVHMNVVPRSTINTNGGTEKCVYLRNLHFSPQALFSKDFASHLGKNRIADSSEAG